MFQDPLLLTAEMERESEAIEKTLCGKPYCHTFPEKNMAAEKWQCTGKKR